jgi:hypothetical protein
MENRTANSSVLPRTLSLLLLLLPVLFYGCAGVPKAYRMYPEPERPKNEIAVIEGKRFLYFFIGACSHSISYLDYQVVILEQYDKIEFIPGFHTVTVRFGCEGFYGGHYQYAHLEFNAEAGHEYKIKVNRWKFYPEVLVIDKNSEEVVSKEVKRFKEK